MGLDEGAPRRERQLGTLGLESVVGTGSVHTRGESREDSQAPAAGQSGVGAGPPQAAVPDRSVSSVLRTSTACTSWKAPGTMSGWRLLLNQTLVKKSLFWFR